jgi:hypothetical protein
MNQKQRIVLALYLVAFSYCFVWIPWSVSSSDRYGTDRQRLGYGWVWAGPQYPNSLARVRAERASGKADFSDVDDFVAREAARDQWDATSRYSVPDIPIVSFRIIALSAVAGAAVLLAGVAKRSAISN